MESALWPRRHWAPKAMRRTAKTFLFMVVLW
jgi:hypothetical protein